MQNRLKRIALVRLSALGDIVNSSIALQLIKRHYPDAQIEWITEEAFAPLIENHPLLHKVHIVPIKRIKKEKNFTLLKETISYLKKLGSFDTIIDMQGLIKSAVVARFVGKNVHGFDADSTRESLASFFYKTTTNIAYEENIIHRNCRVVADALDFTINDEDILNKKPLFKLQKRPNSLHVKKNIAIVIGASWACKIYPKEQIVALCNSLKHRCHILWGSDSEYKNALWIADHCNNVIVAPKMNLTALINFIGHCELTIGNDTGPTHMAWAMNRASITLFGPTNSRMMYETPINIALESDTLVDVRHINKNDFSIGTISPNLIAQKAKELL
ncbi:MAG: lipopolysaccharide heptosyltransferase I [Campylobacterota bacterium]|nr:lipopolysaccharide heptosyltransferase I [Campylobacterota bacterium]